MKAQQFNTIIYFFAFLVIMLILAVWMSKYYRPILESTTSRSVCELSVLQNANQGWLSAVFRSKINCKTQDLTLKGNDNEIKQALAKDMKSCWDSFGRGKLNLFDGDGVYCNICSTIGFEEKGTLEGFKEYLSTARTSSSQSYAEYLSGYENTQSTAITLTKGEITKEDNMDKEKKYALVFVYARGKDRILNNFINALDLAKNKNVITLGSIYASGFPYSIFTNSAGTFVSDASHLITTTAVIASPLGAPLMLYDQFITKSEWISFIQLAELSEQNLNNMGCQMSVNTA